MQAEALDSSLMWFGCECTQLPAVGMRRSKISVNWTHKLIKILVRWIFLNAQEALKVLIGCSYKIC